MNEGQRFEVLDSWRGIAACLVVLFHLRIFAHSHVAEVAFVRHSYLFVDFFFVLSGFVIAANYERRLVEGFDLWRFVLLRFGRLYPLHICMLGVCILIHLAHALSGLGTMIPFRPPERSADTVIANLLLIHSLGIFDFLTWNWPSWSISTEFYTYILYALAIVALKDRIGPALAATVVVSSFTFCLVVNGEDATYDYGILRCLSGFAMGALVWRLRRARPMPGGTLAEFASVALVMALVAGAGQNVLAIAAAPVVFSIAVLIFAAESGALSRLLRKPLFLRLGALAYSIYMVHFVIGTVLLEAGRVLRAAGADFLSDGKLGRELWQGDIAGLAYFASVLFVSGITYRMIEAPGRAWFRRLALRDAGLPDVIPVAVTSAHATEQRPS